MPLFEHYAADAIAVDSAGGRAITQKEAFDTLSTNISGREDAAASSVSGELVAPVQNGGTAPKQDADQVSMASVVAGGATKNFSTAITEYNKTIDRLNERYEIAKTHDFYAMGLCTEEGIQEPSEEDIEAKGKALRADLEKERQRAEDELDSAADFSASLLNEDPSKTSVLSLYLSGDLPADAASAILGMTVSKLNEVRLAVATTRFVIDQPMMMRSLSQYLLKVGPTGLHKYTKRQSARKLVRQEQIRSVMRRTGVGPAKAKAYLRNSNMVRAATPGNLFGKYGKLPRHGANIGKFRRAVSWAGKWGGRVLSPLAIAAGGAGLYSTIDNWDQLPTDRKVTGLLGNTSFIVSGIGGTAAATAYAMSWSFPPAGAAVTVIAGTVALGCMVYENWDSISNFVTETVPNFVTETVPDALGTAGEAVSDFVDDPGGAISEGWDAITPW